MICYKFKYKGENAPAQTITTSFGGSFVLPDGFATNVAYVDSVEITDCPNITYTVADPVTVPITINCTDKSYCYIQF